MPAEDPLFSNVINPLFFVLKHLSVYGASCSGVACTVHIVHTHCWPFAICTTKNVNDMISVVHVALILLNSLNNYFRTSIFFSLFSFERHPHGMEIQRHSRITVRVASSVLKQNLFMGIVENYMGCKVFLVLFCRTRCWPWRRVDIFCCLHKIKCLKQAHFLHKTFPQSDAIISHI